MKRIVKIQNVGNVAFPDHMTDAEVSQAAGKLHAQANQQQQRASKQPATKQWEPSEDDPVARIQTSDGQHWHIHLDDLEKMKRRDPKLKVIQEQGAPTFPAASSQSGTQTRAGTDPQ
jgi:hypothetical protein